MKSRVIQQQGTPSTKSRGTGVEPGAATPTKKRGRVASLIIHHPLAAFFVLAFALTWSTVPMSSFMAAGPLLASLIVLGVTEGKAGIRELGRRMVQWRVRWPFYVAALLVPLAVGFAAGGANAAFGASGAVFAKLEVSSLVLLFALRMVVPVFAPLGEEPGWRGFALPRMQRTHTPFVATLALGVIVAAWHVPLLAISEEKFEPVMLLGTVFVTFWYTWLFNRSGGSVFITTVAHAADGLIGAKLLADHGGFRGTGADRFELLYCVGWFVVAAVVVLADRRHFFGPVTDDALVEPMSGKGTARRLIGAGAVAAVVVTLAVAALGGAASAKTVDHDTYIEQADAICDRTVEQTDAIVEDVGLDPSDQDAWVAGRKVLAVGRTELEQLRALPAPTKDAPHLAAIYRAMDRYWDRVDAKPSVLFDERGPFAKATKLADAYGFEVCGRG